MSCLTYDELRKIKPKSVLHEGIVKLAASIVKGKDIFLAHSSKDNDWIVRVIGWFKRFRASVYVDVNDDELEQPPSTETAETLRKRVLSCPRFVILVSPNSYSSKWIPWELGIADGLKGVSYVALLPISPGGIMPGWASNEYLGLYPRIKKNDSDGDWRVLDPRDNKSWKLSHWLHHEL